jgi:hypothetical protein
MASNGNASAKTAAATGQDISDVAGANAGQVYGALAPELMSEAAHPAGFDPATLASMNTAAQQSSGGSEAAAVGSGALRAARTRNAGAPAAATAAGTRGAADALSKRALDVQNQNAQLKNQQQQSGIQGEENLNATELGTAAGVLPSIAQNVNANSNATAAGYDWMTDLVAPYLNAAGSAARGYAALNP